MTQAVAPPSASSIASEARIESRPVAPRVPITFTGIAWCVLAEQIVVYPEDFGMSRAQVHTLRRQLAERREQLWASRN